MKLEVEFRIHDFVEAFDKNITWFSDECLDDIRSKIQKELDSREFGELTREDL